MGEERSKSRGWGGWCIVLLIVGVLAIGIGIAIKKKVSNNNNNNSSDDAAPVPGPPGAIVTQYSNALGIALQFLDIQKSGKLEKNKITWRGDSALKDGSEAKLDLSKGMFDAGDNVKFGFPMAFTATVLSWAILEYGDQMTAARHLDSAQDSLKWITDYLIAAHPEDNVLYIQVGDPELDHSCWLRPEDMTEKRPLTQVNTSSPGTEVAAETAAAMAAASLVFKTSNPTYSSTLLTHAKQLFSFADKYQVSYSVSIPDVKKYYNSTGYEDELLWAASWLYHATADQTYLDYVTVEHGKAFANWGSPTWFSWDNKLAATQILLARLSFFGTKVSNAENDGLGMYRKTAAAVMCGLMPDSPTATSSRTDSGLIWISEWNALMHPVASAFLATIYSDYMLSSRTPKLTCKGHHYKPADIRKFAVSQAEYVLGSNPKQMSYLVGFGDKYPEFVHHRGASIPANATTDCKGGFKWLESKRPNPNIAYGALVGGPFQNETYTDTRNNSMQNEPTTYNSALLVGLLSGLVTTSSVVQSFT